MRISKTTDSGYKTGMTETASNQLISAGVEKMIKVIRSKQVLLDRDLAVLYGVETKALNQAVKRNIERFPERNCFQLTKEELLISSKSQL